MQLAIKNMVCDRCIMVVDRLLRSKGFPVSEVGLGIVQLDTDHVLPEQLQDLRGELEAMGFELLDERKSRIVEQIKVFVIESVHRDAPGQHLKFSDRLSGALNADYGYLSKIFSEQEGNTIEQYVIAQKIERVKELLSYGELNLNEIALEMGYSSTSALSNQFKKVTGMTPGVFKSQAADNRRPLDKIG
ncbi:AraC family transcriptional regulator [Rurimicrobium arvi]|uniref:HTH araC/xylS-type domain-containing protein n=1 Tax=Rurimicrobium arvi TaxID=2049916 RepID=A0ABP8MIM7_9BACT